MEEKVAEPDATSTSEPMEVETETAVAKSSPAYDFGEGLPSDFRGQYEIMGVVTHKGRSADSGGCVSKSLFMLTVVILLLHLSC